jgi:hypothetical protein
LPYLTVIPACPQSASVRLSSRRSLADRRAKAGISLNQKRIQCNKLQIEGDSGSPFHSVRNDELGELRRQNPNLTVIPAKAGISFNKNVLPLTTYQQKEIPDLRFTTSGMTNWVGFPVPK